MKLNLGAGRVIFPAEREAPPAHLMPLPEAAYEKGWSNVDRVDGPGIDEVVDLFAFPWARSSNGNPWNDNTVEEIYTSHLVEHIPHQVRVLQGLPGNWADDYRSMVTRLDGWFVFFYECWRILKPGGKLHVVAPFGHSVGGMTDPSHTRYILPGSFQYLKPAADGAPFDYRVPCDFEMEPPIFRISDHWQAKLAGMDPEDITRIALTYFDVASELRIELTAVKTSA